MNKLFLILGIVLACTAFSDAVSMPIDTAVNKSSFTVNADTALHLPGTKPGSRFIGVVVATATTSAPTLITIYDSSGTANANNIIGIVGLGAVQNANFNVAVSSAITYSTSGASAGVTIIYRPTADSTHN